MSQFDERLREILATLALEAHNSTYLDGKPEEAAKRALGALMLENKHPSIYGTDYRPESEMHGILFEYGEACEKEGMLSERAVTIRLDLAAHFNDLRQIVKGGDR